MDVYTPPSLIDEFVNRCGKMLFKYPRSINKSIVLVEYNCFRRYFSLTCSTIYMCIIFILYLYTYILHLYCLLWLPHEMERHYVFMLILEFFDLSEIFYISGRVTMSTLRIRVCPSVCLSPDKTNFNSESYLSIFEIYTYLN